MFDKSNIEKYTTHPSSSRDMQLNGMEQQNSQN